MNLQLDFARPDVTLLLNSDGTIRQVTLAKTLEVADAQAWTGQSWQSTSAPGEGEKISRMLKEAEAGGVSAFRQFTQKFPNGRELPMEYTVVDLPGSDDFLAIGKNLESLAELQSRLVNAQQTLEQEYWKLRYLETRYRLLLDASNDPVLLVKAADLTIVEANSSASRALGIPARGEGSLEKRELLKLLQQKDRKALESMLVLVRDSGKSPALQITLGPEQQTWFIRASLVTSEQGLVFLLQFSPTGRLDDEQEESAQFMQLVKRAPDAVVMVNRDGKILKANRAFLDLVQVSTQALVEGQALSRWLGRPGADMRVLLGSVVQQGAVRLFSTTIQGEIGISTEVEISAIGNDDSDPQRIGLVLRDIGSRLPAAEVRTDDLGQQLSELSSQVGTSPLRHLVKETVSVLESHYIQEALKISGGNRTAAAEILGISRQSLYAKLNRYGLSTGADE